jgi:hypothetical protein
MEPNCENRAIAVEPEADCVNARFDMRACQNSSSEAFSGYGTNEREFATIELASQLAGPTQSIRIKIGPQNTRVSRFSLSGSGRQDR